MRQSVDDISGGITHSENRGHSERRPGMSTWHSERKQGKGQRWRGVGSNLEDVGTGRVCSERASPEASARVLARERPPPRLDQSVPSRLLHDARAAFLLAHAPRSTTRLARGRRGDGRRILLAPILVRGQQLRAAPGVDRGAGVSSPQIPLRPANAAGPACCNHRSRRPDLPP